MTRRSRAREVALQLLFQADQNKKAVSRAAIEKFAGDRLNDTAELKTYCLELYDGVNANRVEIDVKLIKIADNWRLNRMMPVDRNVLRLGAFELLFDPNPQPIPVIIDEAIELARRYGSKESGSFVNGILDKVSKSRKQDSSASNTLDKPVIDAVEPAVAVS